MPLGDYTKSIYVEGEAPGISATRLNNNENKTKELDTELAAHKAEKATSSALGHVKVDNATILADANGVISAAAEFQKTRIRMYMGV